MSLSQIVLLTASSIDLATCISVGQGLGAYQKLIGLFCGLPAGGTKSLAPVCSALRARRLLIRTGQDRSLVTTGYHYTSLTSRCSLPAAHSSLWTLDS